MADTPLSLAFLTDDPVAYIGTLRNVAARVWGAHRYHVPNSLRVVTLPNAPRAEAMRWAILVDDYAHGVHEKFIQGGSIPSSQPAVKDIRRALARFSDAKRALDIEAAVTDTTLPFTDPAAFAFWDSASRLAIAASQMESPHSVAAGIGSLRAAIDELPDRHGPLIRAIMPWAVKHARKGARGESIGKLLATPGQIKEAMSQVLTAAHELDDDVQGQFVRPAMEARAAFVIASHGEHATPDQVAEDERAFAAKLGLASYEPMVWAETAEKQGFVKAWTDYENSLQEWYGANSGFFSRMWGGLYEDAQSRIRELNDWRDKFQALGGDLSSPAPREPAGSSWPSIDHLGEIILIGAGILAAAFIVPKLIGGGGRAPVSRYQLPGRSSARKK